jgi:hypothetical protein
METSALLDSVLNYPFLVELLVYDEPETGFNIIKERFNGLLELTQRPDALELLLAKTNMLSQNKIDSGYILAYCLLQQIARERGMSVSIQSVPLIFSARSASEKLSSDKKLWTVEIRSTSIVLYSLSGSITAPGGASISVIIKIEAEEANNGGYPDDYVGYIAALTVQQNIAANQNPGAVLISGPSPLYNCHNSAWNTSYPTTMWMNSGEAQKYWGVNGGYMQTGSVLVGCRAVYAGSEHSGMVVSISHGNTYVQSKWGKMGSFLHPVASCPYQAPITYYKLA